MLKKGITIFLLFLILSCSLFAKTVKVGYLVNAGTFMSGSSDNEPKTGVAYEYLQNVASYTGWEYEYKYGFFNDLYADLVNGDIDLLVDITYTPERAKVINFPEYPMTTETYYLYANRYTNRIEPGDYEALNGKSIALGAGTYQYDLFMDWLKESNINLDITYMPYEDVLDTDFRSGLYDLYLSIDLVSDFGWDPVARIGSSEVYAAITKNRPDLLEELNRALSDLYASDPQYNDRLWTKYFSQNQLSTNLNPREHYWLYEHQIISIGCPRNEKAYLYKDEKTDEFKGLIPFMMERLQIFFDLPNHQFKYLFYDSAMELDAALQMGEVDFTFPEFYDLESAEKRGCMLSRSVLKNAFTIIYSSKELFNSDLDSKVVTIAIPRDCRVGEMIIKNGFFDKAVYEYFDTHEQCLHAVLSKNADFTIFTSDNASFILKSKSKYKKLYTANFYDNVEMSFGVSRKNPELISILNKLVSITPESDIDRVILSERLAVEKLTLKIFIKEYHAFIILGILFVGLLLFGFFMSLGHVQMLINYDVLTHLLNRRTLSKYMKSAINRAKSQDEIFSIMIFDLDNFKRINDKYGHSFGDDVLRMAAETIAKGIKRTDYAFRWGGEEFLVLLKADRNIAYKVAERIRVEIELQDIFCSSEKINVTTTVGVATYKENISEKELFAIADKNLYKGKNNGKNQVVAD